MARSVLREEIGGYQEQIIGIQNWVRQEVRPYLERQTAVPAAESIGLAEQRLMQTTGDYLPLAYSSEEFSLPAVRLLAGLGKASYILNPVIGGIVDVRALYTFGQGMNVTSPVPKVKAILDAFMDDRHNRRVLTGHTARTRREIDAITTGNVIILLRTDRRLGRVRVSLVRFSQIQDVICGPDDEPLFYHRVWTREQPNYASGVSSVETVEMYYPDWRHDPPAGERPETIAGTPVSWDEKVYHIKRNTAEESRFGLSEIVSVRDAADRYVRHQNNISAINDTLATFAMMATSDTAAGAEAMATTLRQRADAVRTGQAQPGGFLVASGDAALLPVKSGGVATSADEGRRQLLLVCTRMKIPEQYLGDPSSGNLATATSMERPVELSISESQQGWIEVFTDILDYAVRVAALVPGGPFELASTADDPTTLIRVDGETVAPQIAVTFPPILEHDRLKLVQALKEAATIPGVEIPARLVQVELLKALGTDDPEEVLDRAENQEDEDELTEAARALARAWRHVGRAMGQTDADRVSTR